MSSPDWTPDFLQASALFEPLRPAGSGLEHLHDWPDIGTLEKLRGNATAPPVTRSGKPVHFVPQNVAAHEFAQQYEPRIYLAGEVQTRAHNWHDLFNALVWLTFPRAKVALNQLHYQALLQEHGADKVQRGPLRDTATLFDESGVIVVSSDAGLSNLLQDFEWKHLFWRQRAAVCTHMRFLLFGHGLYEKALKPYIGMTGKGIILPVTHDFFRHPLVTQLAAIDSMLDDFLFGTDVAPIVLSPVPLLGYPGWSPDNANEAYYDNSQYFRPRPMRIAD